MPNYTFQPPYLQVALDIPDWDVQLNVLKNLPQNERLIIEAGTPLIKRYGIDIVKKIREFFPNNIILADLKTLDVGEIEVKFTHVAGADAAVCAGLANPASIDKFLKACKECGILGVMDLMEVANPLEKLKKLTEKPDIIIFHRAIDAEGVQSDPQSRWKMIPAIKEYYAPNHKVALSVAGGIKPDTGKEAVQEGADILIIGRYITGAENIGQATEKMLEVLK